MGDISASRDIIIIAAIAYIAYKLKDSLSEAKQAASDAAKQAQETFNFYYQGGELSQAWRESQQSKTDTEIPRDVADQWTEYFKSIFGPTAPTVPTPETAADAGTGQGMQETVQVLPQKPAETTPELTPEIEKMIFAPAPDRPKEQIFPGVITIQPDPLPEQKIVYENQDIQRRTTIPAPQPQPIQPIVQPVVPPVTELIRQPAPSRSAPIIETKPLDSMSREQAEAEGFKYSGAVGWYR